MKRIITIYLLLCSVVLTAHGQRIPFKKTDTGPYGTYVLYDQLPELFPDASISITYSSPASKLRNNYQKGMGYFVIAPFVDYSKDDIKALEAFVDKGNVLVISTYFLDDSLAQALGVKIRPLYPWTRDDSIRIANYETGDVDSFHLGKSFCSYISRFDSTAEELQILGKYSNGYVNSIIFKRGAGYVVIQTQPFMFANYHLVKKKNEGYAELFFSSLPGPLSTIYWDEYVKGGSNRGASPLKFVMSKPPLRYAFWWAIAGLLIVVLFSLKRRQRVIPVLSPLTNSSLDMVRTISDLYYFSHRNEVIAKKKIAHWQEYLRVKLNLFSKQSPETFWNSFSKRTDLTEDQVQELKSLVENYDSGEVVVSDSELIRINELIDSSYKS